MREEVATNPTVAKMNGMVIRHVYGTLSDSSVFHEIRIVENTIPVAPATEFVAFWRISIIGKPSALLSASSTFPMQNRTASVIEKPIVPLIMTEDIIPRGMTTSAFLISSAIKKLANCGHNRHLQLGRNK